MVSVIIPYFNEAEVLSGCLLSLTKQSYTDLECIFIDDGSDDNSTLKIKHEISQLNLNNIILLAQDHLGPAHARNLGAKHARGEMLVFADADMTFDPLYIEKLIEPIVHRKAKGTFTKDEYVSNWDNVWARCWNYNEGIHTNRRIPETYPNTSPVFRAILKSEFDRVGGFDPIGFTDDWTLSRKLGYPAEAAIGAICYHRNPSTLPEVYRQARWIGKNEFISGTLFRRFVSLIRYNEIIQLIRGIRVAKQYNESAFVIFQVVYFTGIYISVLKSFIGEGKNR